ncbi:DUF1534 domain-containing protein [Pseudomonas sp. H3(2019)]|nr:DUF1534 domain-containing protein [Pseudomonas sp. H3(2019)]
MAQSRSHALRGNAARDAPRHFNGGRGASNEALPRRAWERSTHQFQTIYHAHQIGCKPPRFQPFPAPTPSLSAGFFRCRIRQ